LEALQRARAQKDQRKQASKAQNLESQTAAAQPAQNFVAETPQPAHQAQQGAHEAQQGEHQAQQQEQPQHLQEPPEPQEPEQQAQQPDSRGIFDQGETTDVPPQANPQAVTRASAPSTAAASASMDAHTHPTDGTAGNFCFGVLSLKHYCFVLL
jgi:hypothetical protein